MRNTFRYSFATVLTAGLVVAPVTAVLADATTDGSGGIGSGNQIIVPVDVEADLCGNSLAVLGISDATCTQVSKVLYEASGEGEASTDGSGGVASGNQIIVPVDAAVDACGNAASVGGITEAECLEVVEVLEEESEDTPTTTTDGSGGVASGNQIIVPVDTAINVCGNSVAILGGSSSKCTTIINVIQGSPENEGGASTDGSGGIGGGNQVMVPVDAAVDICGNAVSVLGLAEASCMEIISEEEPEEEPEKPEEEPEEPEEEKPEEPEEEPEEPEKEPEEPREEDKGEEDDSSTGGDTPPRADDQLPVTGGALAGLVAAGVAAIGAGGAGLYFARKRKAAAVTGDEE